MPDDVSVTVEGLTEFRKQLSRIDSDAPNLIRKANVAVADLVVNRAKAKAESVGGVAAKAAASLRATKTVGAASVRLGGNDAPYAMGAEFGGGSRPRTRQFKPWRGSGEDAGYFLYPTIRDSQSQILDEYDKALRVIAEMFGA